MNFSGEENKKDHFESINHERNNEEAKEECAKVESIVQTQIQDNENVIQKEKIEELNADVITYNIKKAEQSPISSIINPLNTSK